MLALDERIDQVEDRVEDLGEFLAQLARQVATVNASTRRLEQSAKAREGFGAIRAIARNG
jgi:prefoldin subunit 5